MFPVTRMFVPGIQGAPFPPGVTEPGEPNCSSESFLFSMDSGSLVKESASVLVKVENCSHLTTECTFLVTEIYLRSQLQSFFLLDPLDQHCWNFTPLIAICLPEDSALNDVMLSLLCGGYISVFLRFEEKSGDQIINPRSTNKAHPNRISWLILCYPFCTGPSNPGARRHTSLTLFRRRSAVLGCWAPGAPYSITMWLTPLYLGWRIKFISFSQLRIL